MAAFTSIPAQGFRINPGHDTGSRLRAFGQKTDPNGCRNRLLSGQQMHASCGPHKPLADGGSGAVFLPSACPIERGYFWRARLPHPNTAKTPGCFWRVRAPHRAGGVFGGDPPSAIGRSNDGGPSTYSLRRSGISLHACPIQGGLLLAGPRAAERPPFFGCSMGHAPIPFWRARGSHRAGVFLVAFRPSPFTPKTGVAPLIIFPCGKARIRTKTGGGMNRDRSGDTDQQPGRWQPGIRSVF